jgi:uncharacterized repeat protein (TIGR03803 family)
LVAGSDGALYGTTAFLGANGFGTVYRMNQDGSNYSVLWSFGGTVGDGQNPQAGLVEGCGGALYGTTYGGGTHGYFGTVYKINHDGTGYTVLWSLGAAGLYMYAGLISGSDGALYGTTFGGGYGYGTVFKLASPYAWDFDAPTATDACSGTNVTITILSTVTNGVCPKLITRTWRATDACGNTNTCSQTVTVADATPPVITCPGNKTVVCGSVWDFDMPSVFDACSGTNVTLDVLGTVTNNADLHVITRTWVATDACGNTNLCSQTVTAVLPGPIVVVAALTSTGDVQISFNTFNGPTYIVEYKDDLTDPGWRTLTTITGTGGEAGILEPQPLFAKRFYRVRQVCP